MPDALIEELAAGAALSVSPLMDEPGFGTARAFELRGLGAQIPNLVCPSDVPRPATARINLTSEGHSWTGGDLAQVLFPENTEADPIPMTTFGTESDAISDLPALSLDCSGVPFFWENYGANSGVFDVHMVIDGDEANRVTVDYGNHRSMFNPGDVPAGLGARILDAQSLRLTSAANPNVDAIYPMEGAKDALRGAGCQF